jgi:hypothetical protein
LIILSNISFFHLGHKALFGMYSCHGPRVSRERLRQSLTRGREGLHSVAGNVGYNL